VTSFSLATTAASALGNGTSGGGDSCENRIKVIREDIREWILKGGPSGLQLPPGISTAAYANAMLDQIASAKIKCLGPSDEGYPIMVNGVAKTCRFDRLTEQDKRITCDLAKFDALNEEKQYNLVHHEYAGLSGIEKPSQDGSDYTVSNQISAFLADVVVKKLAVKPSPNGTVLDQIKLRILQDGLTNNPHLPYIGRPLSTDEWMRLLNSKEFKAPNGPILLAAANGDEITVHVKAESCMSWRQLGFSGNKTFNDVVVAQVFHTRPSYGDVAQYDWREQTRMWTEDGPRFTILNDGKHQTIKIELGNSTLVAPGPKTLPVDVSLTEAMASGYDCQVTTTMNLAVSAPTYQSLSTLATSLLQAADRR
jgi:hypothetical protein